MYFLKIVYVRENTIPIRNRKINSNKIKILSSQLTYHWIFFHYRSNSIEKIDKEKLLAIARKNALKLIDAGVVPGAEKLTTIKAGGKTVNELTGMIYASVY